MGAAEEWQFEAIGDSELKIFRRGILPIHPRAGMAAPMIIGIFISSLSLWSANSEPMSKNPLNKEALETSESRVRVTSSVTAQSRASATGGVRSSAKASARAKTIIQSGGGSKSCLADSSAKAEAEIDDGQVKRRKSDYQSSHGQGCSANAASNAEVEAGSKGK